MRAMTKRRIHALVSGLAAALALSFSTQRINRALAQKSTDPTTSAPRSNRADEAPTGPLDFRCDRMNMTSKPNKVRCRGHIVARRDNLLVCCDRFEGAADDEWQWREFTCVDRVRAVRNDELMWSEKAHFDLKTGKLVLTGEPRLRRGPNLLDGVKIVIDTDSDRARVTKPRGRLEPDNEDVADNFTIPEGELPTECPLPLKDES